MPQVKRAAKGIFGRSPLSCASRPFTAPILKAARVDSTLSARPLEMPGILRLRDGRYRRILFSNGSRAEAVRVSTLSGACVLCVLVRHLMG
jgi:hypothetical protein